MLLAQARPAMINHHTSISILITCTATVCVNILGTVWDLVLDGLVKVLHKLGVHPKQKTDQLTTLGTRGTVFEIATKTTVQNDRV